MKPGRSCSVGQSRRHVPGWLRMAWPALVAALGIGCAAVPPPLLSYEELLAAATTTPVRPVGEAAGAQPANAIDPAALQRAFLETENFDRRLRDLTVLEQQALALVDQPLRLGAIGSAILDLHYASLVGHRALATFYQHVDLPEQVALHESWVENIVAGIAASAAGDSEDDPYSAFSANEARAFLAERELAPVGAKYHETETHPFQIWIQARPPNSGVRDTYFDLGPLYRALEAAVRRDHRTLLPVPGQDATCRALDICENFSTWAFIHLLAVRGDDSAAQTFVGWKVAGLDGDVGTGTQSDALMWFRRAARAGNGLASLSLANLYLWQAGQSPADRRSVWLARAETEFERSVELGLDSAMYSLGRLYMIGTYGEGKTARGEELVRRAAALDHTEALLALAVRHAYGDEAERDAAKAETYFLRAAEQDENAKVQYARFLLSGERGFNERAWRWLREMAQEQNPDAMVIIGYLYAKGLHVDKRLRRAKTWLKNAVKAAPHDPQVVNEVAWTLTVSPLDGLRDERYALKIMGRVMADESNAARRVPAYLDTWAAAFAANGDFERAIAVQEEAIEQALDSNDVNDLPVLREHLEALRAGELISEDVP